MSKLLCPACDKLKFRCVCPKLVTSTPIKQPPASTACTPVHSDIQSSFVRQSKSINALDRDCDAQTSHHESSPKLSSRLLSFQWPNVFNGRNAKSTSQLNLFNCDATSKNVNVTVPINYTEPHDQLSKGSLLLLLFFISFLFLCF